MFSNFKRAVSLTLLASVAGSTLAAQAPVSDINSNTSNANISQSTSSETEIQRLERLLNNRSRVQVQLQQQIDNMSAEISELRGIVERNRYDMKQMLERQRELFIELDRVRGELQNAGQQPTVAAETPVDADTTAPAKGGTFTTNVNEEAAYKSAVDLILKKKDYAGAISAFKKFQSDFPDSNFAPNAHYWLGQLYFAKKQDIEAAKSFASVVAYPESNKRADSLVKLGDIARRNNKPDVARKYYKQVVNEYPNSASAKTAQRHL